MEPNSEDILIQGLIDGTLSEREKAAFMEKVNASDELKARVEFQRKLISHLEANQKFERKQKMLADFRNLKAEKSQESSRFIFSKPVWYSMAAAIALVAAFFVWSWNSGKNDYQKSFMAYYRPYDGVVITRGNNEPSAKAMEYYYSGQYKEALDLLLKNKYTNISKGQLNLLVGTCHLELNQISESLKAFGKVDISEGGLIKSNADWYKALALLKEGNIKASRKQLEIIAGSASSYASKAKELLKDLSE